MRRRGVRFTDTHGNTTTNGHGVPDADTNTDAVAHLPADMHELPTDTDAGGANDTEEVGAGILPSLADRERQCD